MQCDTPASTTLNPFVFAHVSIPRRVEDDPPSEQDESARWRYCRPGQDTFLHVLYLALHVPEETRVQICRPRSSVDVHHICKWLLHRFAWMSVSSHSTQAPRHSKVHWKTLAGTIDGNRGYGGRTTVRESDRAPDISLERVATY